MQAASHGAWRIRHVPTTGIGPARSIHISAAAKPAAKAPSVGTAKRIASQTRTLLSCFIGHLTAPGLSAHSPVSVPQAARGSAPGRMSSIQERLSFTARHTLSRPAQPLFFPRGPAAPSRSIAQVGLGTARNFSTGRSVFQNLVENVPIAGRALYEADWAVHMQSERDAMKKSFKGKDTKADLLCSSYCTIGHHLLLIPLAPTPTNRVPLPPDVSDHPSLLPLPTVVSIHNSHEMHSLRVSALFSRLDAANVWEKGVVCSAYADRPNMQDVCTILKVEFVGWTMAEVRGVIGESGTGWCALEEVQTTKQEQDDDDSLSDTSSILSGISGDESMGSPFIVEPAQSLVLPTLDFSSSLVAASPPALSRASSYIFSDAETDPWAESSSDGSWADNNYLGFSSDFTSRLNTHEQWCSSRDVSV
ncbi:hypothetical protein BT96DRAFT_920892 [Gymnopus androsaceus JB14]|uniref:Uncharacterized protein n=1 Tax=Gymnopus androsaceus JB14 TaxID=1447944 RepID=A0A6A4HK26_9AGAR|nr:hypothetical protein BT96DRAFT_920892 [Gymnopus androsaceus JB14]